MKTMSDYTLYCNTIQTRKAIELGAPIEAMPLMESPNSWTGKAYIIEGNICALPPTADQMISWLEEQEGLIYNIQIYRSADNTWSFNLYTRLGWNSIFKNRFNSRKEATLAAIDAALEYLSSKQ